MGPSHGAQDAERPHALDGLQLGIVTDKERAGKAQCVDRNAIYKFLTARREPQPLPGKQQIVRAGLDAVASFWRQTDRVEQISKSKERELLEV